MCVHVSQNLNSRRAYVRDYIGKGVGLLRGAARSLDYSSYGFYWGIGTIGEEELK